MEEIVIDIDNSLYARGFGEQNQIHQTNIEAAMSIIRKHYDLIEKEDKKDKKEADEENIYMNHMYHTIGVFGDRGSGKTSFLITLLKTCKSQLDGVEVLRIIDPTLIEHKKPIILSIISTINQLVENKLKGEENKIGAEAFNGRRHWHNVIKKISGSIPAVNEVGKGYDEALWNDEDYVLHTGLAKVNETNVFEENLRNMIRQALTILHKKAFILAFDDVDVDIEQGWNVLECLRKYLSDIHIISIVSGNLKLYGMLVKNNLCRNLTIQNERAKSIMENELEGQYMLKLLRPANRINLGSLHNLTSKSKVLVKSSMNGNKETELNVVYNEILAEYKISDASSQRIYNNFFQSMSLRSQIHFIKDAWAKSNTKWPLDIFTSRLYTAGIDVDTLKLNASITNIVILNYLQDIDNLSDCYLLLPTMADKDVNSILTALTFVTCKHFEDNPFLIFDYMFRIGYIRNVSLSLDNQDRNRRLCKYAGCDQMMSLKNNLGLTMAYVAGKGLGNMKEHIALFGMEGKAKKSVVNALDSALKKEKNNHLGKLLASYPYIRIVQNKNNESRSYYSLFAVLCTVGEILKCSGEDEMKGCLNELKLFRSYQMPQDNDSSGSGQNFEESDFSIDFEQDGVDELAKLMSDWKKEYKTTTCLPPYAIGRIITRAYSSAKNISVASVGEMMNLMVAILFNACLIEESKIKEPFAKQINNNNPRAKTDVLEDNIMHSDMDKLDFTKWMIRCPMLNCFLSPKVYNKIKDVVSLGDNNGGVYNILNKVDCKFNAAADKPSFSGARKEWKKTYKIMRAKLSSEDDIKINIIDKDIDSAIKYIKDLEVFGNVTKRSVEAFCKKISRK